MSRGLHSTVLEMIKEETVNKVSKYEDMYQFYTKAYSYLVECQYIPNSFFNEHEDICFLKKELKRIWYETFNKNTLPYLDIKGYHEKRCPLEYMHVYRQWKRYILQQRQHCASLYFASIISTCIMNGWKVDAKDLYSPYGNLKDLGNKIMQTSWIIDYNKTVEQHLTQISNEITEELSKGTKI